MSQRCNKGGELGTILTYRLSIRIGNGKTRRTLFVIITHKVSNRQFPTRDRMCAPIAILVIPVLLVLLYRENKEGGGGGCLK